MNFEDAQELVDSCIEQIAVTSQGLAEASVRSANFLIGQAILTSFLKEVDEELAKLGVLRDATFSDTISKVEGKNVTEKKIKVAKDVEYSNIRQQYEELEAKREWVKGHIKILENAHILYRSLSREGG